MRPALVGLAMALCVGIWAASGSPASASGPYPDPGFPVVPCSSAAQKVLITSDSQLDPSCAYTGGIEITTSNVTLDCRGASVANESASGAAIRIRSQADEDMSTITVRNCEVSGFTNGIRVTRDGFRNLDPGDEYTHALEDVTLSGNHVFDTRGVGIFVDGYVTDTTISESTIERTGSSGIYLEAGSADNVVTGNRIVDNGYKENGPGGQIETFQGLRFRFWGTGREGISVDGSRRNVIRDNELEGNSAGGIYLYTNCGEYVNSKPSTYFERRYGATGNLIEGNRITGGVSGVWVGARMGESVLPLECSDEPYFEEGLNVITLDRASGNTIKDNVFEGVTYGVRVEDDDTVVTGNEFGGGDPGKYAVIIGTPYRTKVLGEPVSGTRLVDNSSTITGNESPYRWVDGESGTIVTGNTALAREAGICEGKSLPRGVLVMTISFALEPSGSPVTPTPDPLAIPTVGVQDPCPKSPPPPPPDDDPDPDPAPPSNRFQIAGVTTNPKNGTTVLKIKVPGPGGIRLKGTGTVKKASATARAAATVKLKVAAAGKAAKRLKKKGRTAVTATVTFAPEGGAPRTVSRKVKLVRKPSKRKSR